MILFDTLYNTKYLYDNEDCEYKFPFSEYETFWGKYNTLLGNSVVNGTLSKVHVYDLSGTLLSTNNLEDVFKFASSLTPNPGGGSNAYYNFQAWQDVLFPTFVPPSNCDFRIVFELWDSNSFLTELLTPYYTKSYSREQLVILQADTYQHYQTTLLGVPTAILGTGVINCAGVSLNVQGAFGGTYPSNPNPYNIAPAVDIRQGYYHRYSILAYVNLPQPKLVATFYENSNCLFQNSSISESRTVQGYDEIGLEGVRQYSSIFLGGKVWLIYPDKMVGNEFYDLYKLSSDSIFERVENSCCVGRLNFNLETCTCKSRC
jgi:hypothetical protein